TICWRFTGWKRAGGLSAGSLFCGSGGGLGPSPSAHIAGCPCSLPSLLRSLPPEKCICRPGGALQHQGLLVLHHPFDHFPLLDFQGLRQGRGTNQIPLAVLTATLNHLHGGLITHAAPPSGNRGGSIS